VRVRGYARVVQERRVEPRIHSVNLINFREVADEDRIYAVLGTARTTDLSAGGCGMRCAEALPLGAQLHLDLQLGDVGLAVNGTVVRATPAGGEWDVGIRFDDLDELARDGLRLYLQAE
jgi:hypothetical protein